MNGLPLTITLTHDQLDEIAQRVAAILSKPERTAIDRWLTVDQAAAYIGARRQRIYDLRSSGRLGRYGDGSRALIDRNELDSMIAQGARGYDLARQRKVPGRRANVPRRGKEVQAPCRCHATRRLDHERRGRTHPDSWHLQAPRHLHVPLLRPAREGSSIVRPHTRGGKAEDESELNTDVARGDHNPSTSQTFSNYADQWIATYAGRTRRGFREETRDDYKRILDADAKPFLGRMRLGEVRAQDIKAYIQHVSTREVRRDGIDQRIKPNTVRLSLAPVRAMFATALEEGIIRVNPCVGVRIATAITATVERKTRKRPGH